MPDVVAAPPAPAPAPAPTPAPAPAAAPAAPAAAPAPETGILGKAMEFDKPAKPKSAPDKSAKPAPVAPVVPAKPGDKSADEIDWEKADPRYKGEHFKLRRESQEKLATYEKRVKELESKTKEAPGDAKLIEEYQGKIKAMEKEIASTSFQKSPEFKKQYTDKWSSEYKAAVTEIAGLTVNLGDDEHGNARTRLATEQDFQKILRLPPGDQDEAVSAIFGKYSNRVFTRLFELGRIERSAQSALEEHAAGLETRTKEQQLAKQKEDQEYEKAHETSINELQQKWPQYFAPDDKDTEVTEALQKGYEFVDGILKTSETLPLADRAAYSAVLRARAAAFPRVVLEKNRAVEELKQVREELKKYRKSDPGSGDPDAGNPDPATPQIGGIDAHAAAFDKFTK